MAKTGQERPRQAAYRLPGRLIFWTALGALLLAAAGLILAGQQASAQAGSQVYLPLIANYKPLQTSHAKYFSVYEGSKTCTPCHKQEAAEVHGSAHYQWKGDTPSVPNLGTAGKLGGINDFCGYPDINWIGLMTNLDGKTVDGGCSTCHTGLGLKPDPSASAEQLENIDCLICHSETYRRKVQEENGRFRFVPAPEKMTVSLLEGITDITLPNRAACLSCHVYAGGGSNNKRGDLEAAHINPPSASFDVHMASKAIGGAGLGCTDCHTTRDHRIAGRGVDLRETDLAQPVRCTNCHPAQPHDSAELNRHTARVDCAACHIPFFAKITSTDMLRDFRSAEVDQARRLYEPSIERRQAVTPEYRFWDGRSYIYEFGTPAAAGSSGRVLMAGPLGDINTTGAKIYPFKHHQAVQAVDPVTQFIIPLKMGLLFQTGNVDQAVRQGAAAVGWGLPQGYDFIQTERYMGIFHEVSPADEALACADCHEGSRMDFAALGYGVKTSRNGRPLCASCHEDKSDEWKTNFFQRVHDKHVRDERAACTECHTYTPAP